MEQHETNKRQIEVRLESNALLTGGFSVAEALSLVRLREAWKAALPRECGAAQPWQPRLEFARWLFTQGVLQS